MPVSKDFLPLFGSSGQGSSIYEIDQSIRFNDNDSAYLTRTPSSAGNRRTFTYSTWLKRGNLYQDHFIFTAIADTSNFFGVYLDDSSHSTDNTLRVYEYNGNSLQHWVYSGSTRFRDTAAWYHFVIRVDTTNAIANDRIRIYSNGTRIRNLTQNQQPSLNYETRVNTTSPHHISYAYGSLYFDGYQAEINFLDGYAYGPEYFGETNSSGIWIPKAYSGSYGTNGFYITGSDSSNLGKNEASGNTFAAYTSSGLAANDQRADTPTNNQIVFNTHNNQRRGGTLSNGNLDYVGPGTRTNITLTANVPTTGKWVVAYKVGAVSTNSGWQIGLSTANDDDFGDAAGSNEDLDLVRLQPQGSNVEINDKVNNSYITPSPTLPITTSDEFWVAVDMDSGNIFMGIYDASDSTMKFIAADGGSDGNPATGANPTLTASTAQMPRDNVAFSVGSKQTSQHIYLQRSTEVSGTIPDGYTYFENVKDLL